MNFLKKIWRPALAFSLIFVLIKKGPFSVEQLKFTLSNIEILLLGFGVFFFQQILFSLRWKLFTNLIVKMPLIQALRLTLVGQFFNFFVPGGVGGDIVKALELSKNKSTTKSEALSTVMSDRIFGLFAMVTLTFLFLSYDYLANRDEYILKLLFLSGLLFSGITLSLLFLPTVFKKISSFLLSKETPLTHKIEKLISSLHFTFVTFRNLKIQLKSFSFSFIGQLACIYFMYEVVRVLGSSPPSFLIFFSLCCFVFVASAIPIFPAGIGVGQAAIYFLFAKISDDLAHSAVIAVTAVQIFNLFYALIGGVLFSFAPKIKQESANI
jgi:glycosyltransferase 2 family protein